MSLESSMLSIIHLFQFSFASPYISINNKNKSNSQCGKQNKTNKTFKETRYIFSAKESVRNETLKKFHGLRFHDKLIVGKIDLLGVD